VDTALYVSEVRPFEESPSARGWAGDAPQRLVPVPRRQIVPLHFRQLVLSGRLTQMVKCFFAPGADICRSIATR